ncbi:MAG: chromate transporter [Bacilli bacterium]|nr:chromate transporter [Bacilli bacterium]
MIYLTLFYTFFLIGLFTFGGGYAMIPMITEQVTAKGWMSISELQNFIAISEMTPGPFAINIATFIGSRVGGIFGSVCATLGVVLPSLIIIIIVAIILNKFLNNKYVKGALFGVRPVVMALILSTAITFLFKAVIPYTDGAIQSFNRQAFGLIISLGFYVILYKKVNKKALNPILILLLSGLLGLIIF